MWDLMTRPRHFAASELWLRRIEQQHFLTEGTRGTQQSTPNKVSKHSDALLARTPSLLLRPARLERGSIGFACSRYLKSARERPAEKARIRLPPQKHTNEEI